VQTGKVGSAFVLSENPAPHNSLLMDAAAKLISTLLRKPELVTRERNLPRTKEIFSCLKSKKTNAYIQQTSY